MEVLVISLCRPKVVALFGADQSHPSDHVQMAIFILFAHWNSWRATRQCRSWGKGRVEPKATQDQVGGRSPDITATPLLAYHNSDNEWGYSLWTWAVGGGGLHSGEISLIGKGIQVRCHRPSNLSEQVLEANWGLLSYFCDLNDSKAISANVALPVRAFVISRIPHKNTPNYENTPLFSAFSSRVKAEPTLSIIRILSCFRWFGILLIICEFFVT